MVDDGLWCQEFNEGLVFDDQAAHQIKKVVASLKTTSGPPNNSQKGTGVHGISRIIVFMCLAVSLKGGMAMMLVG